MTSFQKTVAIIAVLVIVLGYSAYVSRSDPDLKDGIRCIVEQLAQHRVGARSADDAAADFHGYKFDPSRMPGYANPPTPTGLPVCDVFLKAED